MSCLILASPSSGYHAVCRRAGGKPGGASHRDATGIMGPKGGEQGQVSSGLEVHG